MNKEAFAMWQSRAEQLSRTAEEMEEILSLAWNLSDDRNKVVGLTRTTLDEHVTKTQVDIPRCLVDDITREIREVINERLMVLDAELQIRS